MFTCLISTDSDHGKQTALIGGVAGVGAFGLIAVIALGVLCVNYCKAQRIRRANERVQLHANQNCQMWETNLGVSELDLSSL